MPGIRDEERFEENEHEEISEAKSAASKPAMSDIAGLLTTLEEVYRDIHSHPELSMLETRTAGLAADHLREAGFNVTTCVGKTGVVGIIKNGHGPTVMLRADMDALPMKEETGLSYTSTAVATNRAGEKVPAAMICI